MAEIILLLPGRSRQSMKRERERDKIAKKNLSTSEDSAR